MVGRTRRHEGVFAPPLVEHAAVVDVHRLVVQRTEVAVHDLCHHFVGRVDVVMRSDFVVADPDMPTPEDIAVDVLHGDHGVALRASGRKGHITLLVDGRPVDDLARHGLVPVVARLPQQFCSRHAGYSGAVGRDVVAPAVALAVALDRSVEFIGFAGVGDVAVRSAFGAEVDAPLGTLDERNGRTDLVAVFLAADDDAARERFGAGIDRRLDGQGIVLLAGDGEPVARAGVIPGRGVCRHDDRNASAVGVEDQFVARHLHISRPFGGFRPDLGGFGAACQ